MSKQEFLAQLRKGLSSLPQNDIEERLTFYSEMIDDRMEEGLSEAEAVCAIGGMDEILSQSIAEIPLTKPVKHRMTPKKRMKAWEIVLMALGSPVWLSLLIAVFAVILALYVSAWSVIISLWITFVSLAACALGGVIAGAVFAVMGQRLPGIAVIGAGIVCAGLSIFLFYGCWAVTKGILILTKKLALWTKNRFARREES